MVNRLWEPLWQRIPCPLSNSGSKPQVTHPGDEKCELEQGCGAEMVRMLQKESAGHSCGHLILGVKLRKGLGRRREGRGESRRHKHIRALPTHLTTNLTFKRGNVIKNQDLFLDCGKCSPRPLMCSLLQVVFKQSENHEGAAGPAGRVVTVLSRELGGWSEF